jgi:hypothetical protein
MRCLGPTQQQAGVGAYHVLVAGDGSVLGRFNLHFVEDGCAELGVLVTVLSPAQLVSAATAPILLGAAE